MILMQALSIFYWVLFAFPGNCIPGSEKAVTFQFMKWRLFLFPEATTTN